MCLYVCSSAMSKTCEPLNVAKSNLPRLYRWSSWNGARRRVANSIAIAKVCSLTWPNNICPSYNTEFFGAQLCYYSKSPSTICKTKSFNFQAKPGKMAIQSCIIHSFRLLLQRLFKSTTTRRGSQHSTDHVLEFRAKASQATTSERLAQGPYVAARAGFKL